MCKIGLKFIGKATFLIWAQCSLIFTSIGCNSMSPFFFDDGRLIVKSTRQEQEDAKYILSNISVGNVPADMYGGVLLDGTIVKRLPDDTLGQTVWVVKPGRFFIGKEQALDETIELTSPRLKDGGVCLKIGKKYRIFTVNFEGKFFVWNMTVLEIHSVEENGPGEDVAII